MRRNTQPLEYIAASRFASPERGSKRAASLGLEGARLPTLPPAVHGNGRLTAAAHRLA